MNLDLWSALILGDLTLRGHLVANGWHLRNPRLVRWNVERHLLVGVGPIQVHGCPTRVELLYL